tara:strand:- start:5944 stop:6393 length:450 start_codon:yes stop_codon:yes gene_type:complete
MASAYASTPDLVEKWTQYRITEMFELASSCEDEGLSQYFTESAWDDYLNAIEDSHLIDLADEQYTISVDRFIKPIRITQATQNTYFAQTTFLLRFSNHKSTWAQPVELILTIKDNGNALRISEFEGITGEATDIKNFRLDHMKDCNLNQ